MWACRGGVGGGGPAGDLPAPLSWGYEAWATGPAAGPPFAPEPRSAFPPGLLTGTPRARGGGKEASPLPQEGKRRPEAE